MENDTNFFKRLPRQRIGGNARDNELAEARSSIYRWWYEYLKLSKDYWWMSQISNHRSADEAFQNVWNGFGDIYKSDFDRWWMERGRYLFVEQRLPRKVKELDMRSITPSDFDEGQMVLSIPLTIRKETVMRQIRKILNQHYDRQYDVLQHSTAQCKLYTGRYRQESIAIAYEVWITHRQHVTLKAEGEKLTLWEIGEMLNLSGKAKVYINDDPKSVQEKRRVANALVSRYLRKANALIKNAEIGKFPCYDNIVKNPQRFNTLTQRFEPNVRFTERQQKTLTARDAEWDTREFVFPSYT